MPDDQDLPRLFRIFNEIGIISQLSRAMFEARFPDGVGLPQFSLINHLIRVSDGQTPLTLARAFQVPKTTMTHTINSTAKQGWVEVRPHPRDGRSKTVWLTPAGRAFRDQAVGNLVPDLRGIAAVTSPEAQDALLAHLTDLRKFLDADRDPPQG